MNHYPEKNHDLIRMNDKFQLLPGYSGLYLGAAFRNLGMSLIGLFIPLYILSEMGRIYSGSIL